MQPRPLRTTVIGSYPFPGWLELVSTQLHELGTPEIAELQRDAVVAAVADQMGAGLDVISDGEQTRFDFNLSFYGHLDGIQPADGSLRRFGPPAHDQRGKYAITGVMLETPYGLGAVEEFQRLNSVAEALGCSATTKASVPGPYTLSGRLLPNEHYRDRYAITEALLPIVRDELRRLVAAGCTELTIDEPSMSCYAYREDRQRLVDIFNRTVEWVVDSDCRLSTHLCFGNYKGHAVGRREYGCMFPDFLQFDVDEIHVEMANREFAELEIIEQIAKEKDVAVGIVDVKSYYIETVDDIERRVQRCLQYAPADRLAFAPDCGLSQTARWAATQKLQNMVSGVQRVREKLGLA